MSEQLLEKYNMHNLTSFSQVMGTESYYNEEDIIISLDIESYKANQLNNFTVNYIGYKDDIDTWIRISSDSFSKYINYELIHNVAKNIDIDFLLVFKDDVAIDSAMIFKDNNIVSIHFLKDTSYQNQEIIEHIIQEVVDFANREQIKYITLFSSISNIKFYKSLGFNWHINVITKVIKIMTIINVRYFKICYNSYTIKYWR